MRGSEYEGRSLVPEHALQLTGDGGDREITPALSVDVESTDHGPEHARLTLAHESGAPFDLLVIDAYSSDAIPIHLMTVEALALYLSRLAPNGLLALHTTSRYYKLAPLLANAASVLGLRTLIQTRHGTADEPIMLGESPSEVVLMSRDSKALEEFSSNSRWRELKPNGQRIWTDDHANLLAAF